MCGKVFRSFSIQKICSYFESVANCSVREKTRYLPTCEKSWFTQKFFSKERGKKICGLRYEKPNQTFVIDAEIKKTRLC